MKMWELECQLCGNEFMGTINVQKYCPKCKRKAYELKKQGKLESLRIVKNINCECCGKLFPKFAGKRLCEQCEALTVYERRSIEYIKEVEVPQNKVISVSEMEREARKRGMSYGQYQDYLREQRLSETVEKA